MICDSLIYAVAIVLFCWSAFFVYYAEGVKWGLMWRCTIMLFKHLDAKEHGRKNKRIELLEAALCEAGLEIPK